MQIVRLQGLIFAMKFVYALISGPEDYYTEQSLISMYSLRLHNPGCHIVLVTDNATLGTLTGNRSRIKEYVDEFVTIDAPVDFTPTQKSRFLKTSLRQNVTGNFLYLDNDTIIRSSLSELDRPDCVFAAVLDGHAVRENNIQLNKYLHATGIEPWNYRLYFNSGVWFVRDCEAVHKFFHDWHRIWNEDREKYGISIDQPAFARANIENRGIISELSGKYNCQIVIPRAKLYMFDAKIIHYFAELKESGYFPIKQDRLLADIRENGICGETARIIEHPLLTWAEHIIRGGKLKKVFKNVLKFN